MHLLGSHLDFLTAFLGGVLVSFTPCVYPLIPVTLGYIGINASGNKFRGFLFTFIYVTGIAVIYSLLGVVASLGGLVFGTISTHPITRLVVGIIILFFGLAQLDLFNLPMFHLVKIPQLKKHGYFSVFVLGLGSGLVISPCLTPVLGGILAYLATKKNLFYGATLLVSFAYGMGLVLILSGLFISALTGIPKLDKWMVCIKRACAVILLCSGGYFIFTAIRGY